MKSKKIIVGLVTHPNSKYVNEIGIISDFENLIRSLKNFHVENKIHSQEIEYIKDLTFATSLKYIIDLFLIIWRSSNRFHSNGGNILYFFNSLINIIFFTINLILKVLKDSLTSSKNFYRYVNRQYNITQSHLSLFNEGINNDCNFLIIVEDDIKLINSINIGIYIDSILKCMKSKGIVAVNISNSFSDKELGMNNFIKDAVPLAEGRFKLFRYNFVNLNTVCATIYDGEYLKLIVDEIKKIKFSRIIPIDHVINEALISLSEKRIINNYAYAQVKPGLFNQLSLENV